MTTLFDLVEVHGRVAQVRSRRQKTALLSDFLRPLDPHLAGIAASLLAGVPPLGGLRGESTSPAGGANGVPPLGGRRGESTLRMGYATVEKCRQGLGEGGTQGPTLRECLQQLVTLSELHGPGSEKSRQDQFHQLLARSSLPEREFLCRLVVGELRAGALEGVVLEAVAQAAQVPLSSLHQAMTLCGSLTEVTETALSQGQAGLSRFRLQLFRPLAPMLAQPAQDIEEALERLGEASFEWKLDGARVQVHRLNDRVRVYSRNLNDVTEAVPEVVEAALALPCRELVLDGETIALRPDGTPHPFQVTMRRFGRRRGVAELRPQLPLSNFFFDCLQLDGQTLLGLPYRERLLAMDDLLPAPLLAPRRLISDREEAEGFFQETLSHGHEGLMAKSLDSPYEAGGRGSHWLKLKPAPTLDLVVLAAEWGSGRRQGKLSNLHLGARDAQGGFVMLGKTFKGLTDEVLEWQTQHFLRLELGREGHVVHLRPETVVEIAFSELQASPHYPGGMALRFARVKRYRADKQAHQADTIDTVRAIFQQRFSPAEKE